MPYEIFTRKIRRVTSPSISVTTYGRIALNKAATAIFERNAVENVLLLWDADNLKMAIRPITKRDGRAYKLHYGKNGNGAGFNAKTFLDHIKYDYSSTFAMDTTWNEEEQMFEVEIPVDRFKKQQAGKLLEVAEARKIS